MKHTNSESIVLWGKIFLGALLSVALTSCNGGKNKPNIELVQDMMDQISLKAQDWDPMRGGEGSQRVPPEGTVARGLTPFKYAMDPIGAGKNLKNPLAGQFSPEVMARGKDRFDIYCSICHGVTGAGDGPVAAKMNGIVKSLLTQNAKSYSDGRIFHVITMGQGVMGSYASQIYNEKDRWAVINYVRQLQKASEAK